MTTAYLDASTAMKLLVHESESLALRTELGTGARDLYASWLLHTELHCASGRRPETISAANVDAVLRSVNLVDPTRGDFLAAGTHTPLRSGDAIHLATALRLGVDEFLTYDHELAAAAQGAGLRVIAPA